MLLAGLPFPNLPPNHALSTEHLLEKELSAMETGLILFDQVLERYWSGEGTQIGNLGLLNRTNRSFEYIGDPAIRYYLMARVELYKGQIVLAMKRRAKARRHFLDAMKLSEQSLNYQESSDALRVRAEAGYAWLYSKRLWRRTRVTEAISQWAQQAVHLDQNNTAAEIIQIQIKLRKAGRGDKALDELRSRLEILAAKEDIDQISLFRTRMLLSKIHRKNHDKEEAGRWCDEAARIFPRSPMVEDCR